MREFHFRMYLAQSREWGWTGGAGAEWAVFGPWTAKAEYLFYSLKDNVDLNYGVVPGGAQTVIHYKFRNEGQIFRLGLNYKFGQSTGP